MVNGNIRTAKVSVHWQGKGVGHHINQSSDEPVVGGWQRGK